MIGVGMIALAMALAYWAWCWRDVRLMQAVAEMRANASDFLRRRIASLEQKAADLEEKLAPDAPSPPLRSDNIKDTSKILHPPFGKKPRTEPQPDGAA